MGDINIELVKYIVKHKGIRRRPWEELGVGRRIYYKHHIRYDNFIDFAWMISFSYSVFQGYKCGTKTLSDVIEDRASHVRTRDKKDKSHAN